MRKTTVLFVTHDAEEAIYLSTRILVFSDVPEQSRAKMQIPFWGRSPLEIERI
jgi:ABC-type nitrate/sulfonate/bicarbonate transport system ATPase subunit